MKAKSQFNYILDEGEIYISRASIVEIFEKYIEEYGDNSYILTKDWLFMFAKAKAAKKNKAK